MSSGMEQTLILPLDSAEATLATVGGKGANLAKLAQAGFPVPGGFIVTTDAYRAFVSANNLDAVILDIARQVQPDDPAALEAASRDIQNHFTTGTLMPDLAEAIRAQYAALGRSPVAVRSSATAEDLP